MRVLVLGLVGGALTALAAGLSGPVAAWRRATLSDDCIRTSDSRSCDTLGDRLERETMPRRYPEEPGLYFALACELGLARSCVRAQPWARRYSDYEALETDVGCMLRGNAFACEEVSNALRTEHEEGKGDADMLDLARARARRALDLYLQDCAQDRPESCLGASRVYWRGLGVASNPPEARAKEARACALGLGEACELEADDRGGPDAIPLYRKACELTPPSPHACLKLARAYEAAAADPSVVGASYERACDLLSVDACLWVSRRVEHSSREK